MMYKNAAGEIPVQKNILTRKRRAAFILVNTLTFLRVPLSAASYILLVSSCSAAGKLRPLLYAILFLAVALTDFFDGKAARFFRVQSPFGAISDVCCDFLYIASSCFALYRLHLFPLWMLAVITLKLAEFVATSTLARSAPRSGKQTVFIFDFVGRYTAIGFYLLPVIIVVLHALMPWEVFYTTVHALFFILAFFAAVSSAQRLVIFFNCGIIRQ